MAGNPKKVVHALIAVGANIEGLQLREFTTSTVLIMEQIKCPLLQPQKTQQVQLSNLDLVRLLFVLTHPCEESYRLLSQGSAVFDCAAVAFGDTIPIGSLPKLGLAMNNMFAKAMSTAPVVSDPIDQKKTASGPSSRTSPEKPTGSAGS